MTPPLYPSLYQINTRVWLTDLSRGLGRTATLDDIPDTALDQFKELGFDWIWLLSVWQTGLAGQQVSRANPDWLKEFRVTLPDLKEADIVGSGFAVTEYAVHVHLGGDAALARLRARLRSRGLKLMLDFVPNHTALDHPWVKTNPDYYVIGTETDLIRSPKNYVKLQCQTDEKIFAHGRDPYFPGWPDTLQLNYGNPATQAAMLTVLKKIVGQCDGLRCDMAMLELPDVFQRTWGIEMSPFWPQTIRQIHQQSPHFWMLAEVYWDLEWRLQQDGFDYTYDKRLYDRLCAKEAPPIRAHLTAGLEYQNKMARFLENHDEPRAAATFPVDIHRAAAVITYLTPGLRFFYQGQLQGRKIRVSPHLCRAPEEPVDQGLAEFYNQLLSILRNKVIRDGQWKLLDCIAAWPGNDTWRDFLGFAWQESPDERWLVAVNYAPHASQCYMRLPFNDLSTATWKLNDLLSSTSYERQGDDLGSKGLYLDVPPWYAAVFKLDQYRA